MREIARGALEVKPGLWRLSAAVSYAGLEVNCYLIGSGGEYCLVDAGPAALADLLVPAARALAPISSIAAIVALDDGPFSHSALASWTAAGFRGELIADWRTAAALALGGVDGVRDLREDEPSVFAGTGLSMRVLRLERRAGALALLHEATGVLFSGIVASSLGRDLPALCEDPSLAAQARYIESFGLDAIPSADPGAVSLICPRFGSMVAGGLAGAALRLGGEASSCPDGLPGLGELERELSSLRSTNYDLKESMIGSSDAALRDAASGLYGRAYADAFVKELVAKGSGFCAAFARIDRIKELNRRIGAQAVDVIIRDLAEKLRELEPEGFLFRWTGPIILVILTGERGEILGRLDADRRAIAGEGRFASPITVSIALVGSEELVGDRVSALLALSRERLRLLDRRGGDAVLDRSDLRIEDRSVVLALDSDPLFLDFLVEYLEREGFRTMGASRGGEALETMDRIKPELVICDLSLPQFDAFQIRARMRASSDLRDIPFILLSASKSDDAIARAHSLGVLHFFTKPVSMVELAGVARILVSRSEDGA